MLVFYRMILGSMMNVLSHRCPFVQGLAGDAKVMLLRSIYSNKTFIIVVG